MTRMDFPRDDNDRRELARLGVCPAQIKELRLALTWVKIWISPPPAKNAIKAHLTEIRDAATALHQRLGALYPMPGADYQHSAELLGLAWVAAADSDNATVPSFELQPQLKMLLGATDRVLAELAAQGPARHRTGDPRPVELIETALIVGWEKELAEKPRTKPAKPYPKELLPSSQKFKDVVRLVYAAAGYTRGEPKRAIENFVASRNKRLAGAAAAIQEAIDRMRTR